MARSRETRPYLVRHRPLLTPARPLDQAKAPCLVGLCNENVAKAGCIEQLLQMLNTQRYDSETACWLETSPGCSNTALASQGS
jgi:hypothetical protein